MECVEWEERARASEPAAAVRPRRTRAAVLVLVATLGVVGLAVATSL